MRPGTVVSRLNRGMSVDHALQQNKTRICDVPITVHGEVFPSHKAAADYYGIGLTTFLDRLKRQGLSPDEAVSIQKRNIPRPVSLEGNKFSNITEGAQHYKIDQNVVASRLKRGWSLQEAFGIKERPDTDISGVVYLITNKENGMQYVGHTRTTALKRWKRHTEKVGSGKFSENSLHKAIFEYGEEVFELRVIAKSDRSLNDLLRLERKYIKKYRSRWPMGYNHSSGGEYNKVDPTKYCIEGKEFATLEQVGGHYGITIGALIARLQRGVTLEEAVKMPARYRRYVLEGKEYSGLKEACQHYGLKLGTVKARLERGLLLEEAFEIVDSKRLSRPFILLGIKYNNRSEAARAYGVSPGAVRTRLKNGWTQEQAFGIAPPPENKHGTKHVTVEGVQYYSIAEAARAYDKKPVLVRERIIKRGWSIEESLELIPRERIMKGKITKVENQQYPSLTAASKAYGLNPKTVQNRIKSYGWTLEQALGLQKPPERKHHGK